MNEVHKNTTIDLSQRELASREWADNSGACVLVRKRWRWVFLRPFVSSPHRNLMVRYRVSVSIRERKEKELVPLWRKVDKMFVGQWRKVSLIYDGQCGSLVRDRGFIRLLFFFVFLAPIFQRILRPALLTLHAATCQAASEIEQKHNHQQHRSTRLINGDNTSKPTTMSLRFKSTTICSLLCHQGKRHVVSLSPCWGRNLYRKKSTSARESWQAGSLVSSTPNILDWRNTNTEAQEHALSLKELVRHIPHAIHHQKEQGIKPGSCADALSIMME